MNIGQLAAGPGAGGPGAESGSQKPNGLAELDSQAFMKLLITELKNQDPLEPMKNQQLLQQLSTMRNLQSNIELGDSLKAVTENQQMSTATGLLGRSITGFNADQREVSGIADRAFLRDGKVIVGLGDDEVALDQVSSINLTR